MNLTDEEIDAHVTEGQNIAQQHLYNCMNSDPFDEEWDKDTTVMVDSEVSSNLGQRPITIESMDDLKRHLSALTSDQLAFLWTMIKHGNPPNQP